MIIPSNNTIAHVILEDNMNENALFSRVPLDPKTKPNCHKTYQKNKKKKDNYPFNEKIIHIFQLRSYYGPQLE